MGRLASAPVAPRSLDATSERGALLSAASRVLERGGYPGLRVDDVLAEAGLSTRAFYRHFAGKSELFVALFELEMHRADERLRSKLAAAHDARTAVETWIRAALGLAYDPRLARRTRLFFVEQHGAAREHPIEITRCVQVLVAPLTESIERGVADGSFTSPDPASDAVALHHLCAGLMTDHLLGTGTLGREAAVALALRFALRTLEAI